VLYSDGFEVIDRRLGPPLGSDHRPVVVDLALVEQ
jgi:endonuclease/exonuclease/phosphatase (EEP) superfamily protein YafD